MKKSILMLGLAVAAMTSCTNDEVLEQNQSTQKAIGFETFVNKGTRAVEETTSDITKFYAYGYYNEGNSNKGEVVFNGTTVSKTNAKSSEWTYDLDANVDDNQVAYWTKNVYQFAGYANGNEADALSYVTFANANSIPTLTITDYEVSDNNDLVVGLTSVDNAASDKSSQKVSFTFKHLLSKVKFTVINNDNKYKMRITSPLTITGVNTKGTCTITKDGASWTDAEETVERNNFVPVAATAENTYIPIYNAQTNNTDYRVNSEEYFVLPQTLTDVVKFSITATFYDNNNQVVAVKTFTGETIVNYNNAQTPVSIAEWEPGYVYHYNISLPTAAKPIEFGTPTIGNWESGGVIELNPGDTGTN